MVSTSFSYSLVSLIKLSYGMFVVFFILIMSNWPLALTSMNLIFAFSFKFVIASAQGMVGTSGNLLASVLHPEYLS